MLIHLTQLPRTLDALNIDHVISSYLELLNQMPVAITANNVFDLLKSIKRNKISTGPYPDVSLFESANRIMSDLTILFGVKELLKKDVAGISFDQYTVELGNEHNGKHDIQASKNGVELIGEAFNVSESFFQGKKAQALKKLRSNSEGNKILLLVYNSDAVRSTYKYIQANNEYHLAVNVML